MLARLGLAGNGIKGRAVKKAADMRAEALGQTILTFRKAGLSVKAIAIELNLREVPTARGGKWHRTTVNRLLHRLKKLELSLPPAVAADDS